MYEKTWKQHKGVILDSINGFDVIDCKTCGFKHIVPIPSQEELEKIYKSEYYTKEKPLYIDRAEEDIEWWDLVYSERYDFFEKILGKEKNKILDIGSGPGYFLLHGKKRGWKTKGIEPSYKAASYSKSLGLDIIEGFFDNKIVEQLDKFNVIHMSEVLEHVPNPKELLNLAFSLLEHNGILCISVPNDYNPFQKALVEVCNFNPWWIAPPHHINYFDFDSLENLLKKCGFKVILRDTSFPIDIFLLMGINYVGNDIKGRQCHIRRMNFEKTLYKAGLNDLKRRLYSCFANIGIGRHVVLYSQKIS